MIAKIAYVLLILLPFTMGCNNYDLLEKIKNPGRAQENFTNNYYVFVSSWQTLGAMGGSPYADCNQYTGADRADCACTRAAISRNLRRSSTHVFRAWLSTTSANAICRVQAAGNSCGTSFPGPWFNTSGQTVVSSFSGFSSGTITKEVRYDESGTDQGVNLIWTGTSSSGTTITATHCNDWTDMTSANNGEVGDRTSFAAAWTDSGAQQCQTSQRIYCVAAPAF